MGERARRAVVTGANSGVGYETTLRLAASGWRVVMLCRSPERGREALDRAAAETGSRALELELADLADRSAVDAAARRILEDGDGIDALVLNAGLYSPERKVGDDGFERTMAVNHLGHVLLAARLLGSVIERGGRVVSVTSAGHRRARPRRASPGELFEGAAWKGGMQAYCDSKLANLLFAFELDRRFRSRGVRADAVHPGVLATRIWDRARGVAGVLARIGRFFMDAPDEGGQAVARVLLDPDLADGGGRYFERGDEAEASADGRDAALAARYWRASLDALGLRSLPSPPRPPASPDPPPPGPG